MTSSATPSPNRPRYRIAVIAGDGIGQETVPEGLRVLEAAAGRFGFDLQLDTFDFAHCDHYLKHGEWLPRIRRHPRPRPWR